MHQIRLRKPWSKQIGDQVIHKQDVPDQSDHATVTHSVGYRRAFNLPTGLNELDKVFLSITDIQGSASIIELNDRQAILSQIPASDFPIRIEITTLLQQHNQLKLVLEPAGNLPPLLLGEVCLEIESSDS